MTTEKENTAHFGIPDYNATAAAAASTSDNEEGMQSRIIYWMGGRCFEERGKKKYDLRAAVLSQVVIEITGDQRIRVHKSRSYDMLAAALANEHDGEISPLPETEAEMVAIIGEYNRRRQPVPPPATNQAA